LRSFLITTDSAPLSQEVSALLETLVGTTRLEVLHEDGRLALSRIQTGSPCLALLPLAMRHMEALTLLRILGPVESSRVVLLVPDTLDGLRVGWEGLCLGASDLIPTKGDPPQKLRGNDGQRIRQLAQHLSRTVGTRSFRLPQISPGNAGRPWLVLPETRHLISVAEWLCTLPREFPILLHVPEGPRFGRVVREELGRRIPWPVRQLVSGDRLVSGQVHIFSEPEAVRICPAGERWAARLRSTSAAPGSWAARRELLATLGESAAPLGVLLGEAFEPEEESLLRFNPEAERELLSIEGNSGLEAVPVLPPERRAA
jgi:chemotaxis response regulator CheB